MKTKRTPIALIAIFMLLVIPAAIIGVRAYKEKTDLGMIEASMESLLAEIQPLGVSGSIQKGCGRPDEVFGEGNLSCSMGIEGVFQSVEGEVGSKISDIEQALANDFVLIGNQNLPIVKDNHFMTVINSYRHDHTNLNCYAVYQSEEMGTISTDSLSVQYSIYCPKQTLFEYF